MSNELFGELDGLKPSQLEGLEKLYGHVIDSESCVPATLVAEISLLSRKINRMVGVILDRRGEVKYVVVGRADRLYLPDLGRSRAGAHRLRGLRLIALRPVRTLNPSLSISPDFLIDLEKLRLDCVAEIVASIAGEQTIFLGSLARGADGTVAEVAVFHTLRKLPLSFSAFIDQVESGLKVETPKGISTKKNQAVLIGAYRSSERNWRENLDELVELAKSCQISVVDVVSQRKQQLDPKTVVGSGKLEEICLHALAKGAELLIFDGELSPSQLNAITQMTNLKVIDRTMLILDIFAQRAKSKGGRMQVELAQLKYSLPRLSLRQSGLSRLTGGIGGRGPGETRLEIDKRRARDKITKLEHAVEQLTTERVLRRKLRTVNDLPIISIVGYTNAGKSTLLNRLTKSEVYVQDELFATLDPTSRRLRFSNGTEAIITDTVGFIRELPEGLIHAFRATLEELAEADLVLHVVDASNKNYKRHIEVVNKLLKEIVDEMPPQVIAVNKCDKLSPEIADEIAAEVDGIAISAVTGTGLVEMLQRCLDRVFHEDIEPRSAEL